MKNLAGDKECDVVIAEELRRSSIPSKPYDGRLDEVPSRLHGQLGPFEFSRAWYYWRVSGPVPMDIARKLYEDPVGRTDIRVKGHCGCPAPDEYCKGSATVDSYHIDTEVGLRIFADAVRHLAR